MNSKRINDVYWGIVIAAIGGLFLARNLGYLDFYFSMYRYWPVILIVVGISVVIKSSNDRKRA